MSALATRQTLCCLNSSRNGECTWECEAGLIDDRQTLPALQFDFLYDFAALGIFLYNYLAVGGCGIPLDHLAMSASEALNENRLPLPVLSALSVVAESFRRQPCGRYELGWRLILP